MVKVSVIIPAYNQQAFIEATLQAVLAQSFTDFEVLVVNDGSTDTTVSRVEAFADPRIRIVHQLNRGLAGARNTGIREARGEYLAFLDSDDLWHPDKLSQHVAHLDRRPEVGVSYSQSAFIDDEGRSMNYLQSPKLLDVDAADVFLRNPVGNGSAPVIRAAVMREIAFLPEGGGAWTQYFDETFRQSEDIECWMRIALLTHWRFEGIGLPLTYYRVNAGGLSANLTRQFETWERMVAKMRRYAPEFTALHENASRGYQLRYLARRAIRMGAAGQGLKLLVQALRCHPGMLLQEPVRTLVTAAAGVVRACLPDAAYRAIESASMRLTRPR